MKLVVAIVALLSVAAVVEAQAVTHVFSYRGGKGSFYNARNKKTYSAYSGDQAHYNKEQFQNLRAKGPIPVGKWKVVQSFARHPNLGTLAHWIEPVAVPNRYGRSEFFVHGDNSRNNHTASAGCIIVDNDARAAIKQGDFVLVKLA
eukprot:TRINITY_DN304_c0_g1_i6.p1 TRINITY_DN304_c0_g1~~TRINITY_DN304_c0_g1_i6.p1  ORF type:complete len:146 (+),score=42.75 TRINITY_DN304_c0_g1_i6:3-440(+)